MNKKAHKEYIKKLIYGENSVFSLKDGKWNTLKNMFLFDNFLRNEYGEFLWLRAHHKHRMLLIEWYNNTVLTKSFCIHDMLLLSSFFALVLLLVPHCRLACIVLTLQYWSVRDRKAVCFWQMQVIKVPSVIFICSFHFFIYVKHGFVACGTSLWDHIPLCVNYRLTSAGRLIDFCLYGLLKRGSCPVVWLSGAQTRCSASFALSILGECRRWGNLRLAGVLPVSWVQTALRWNDSNWTFFLWSFLSGALQMEKREGGEEVSEDRKAKVRKSRIEPHEYVKLLQGFSSSREFWMSLGHSPPFHPLTVMV